MGKVWVQLTQVKHIERAGKLTKYQKGDFVQVGKQTALLWIAEGSARSLDGDLSTFAPSGKDLGVLLIQHESVGREILKDLRFPVESGPPSLPWDCTFLWNPDAPLRSELLPLGFNFLSTWEIAVPLLPYEHMAVNHGSKQDQAETAKVVPDLRVPLYDPRIIFARRTESNAAILYEWQDDVANGSNTNHAFLRAVYRRAPFILALPPTWANPAYRSEADDW